MGNHGQTKWRTNSRSHAIVLELDEMQIVGDNVT